MRRACILFAMVGTAAAQPAKAPCIPPTFTVTLYDHAGSAVVLAYDPKPTNTELWLELDANGSAARAITKPDFVPALYPKIKRDKKGTSICLGTTCRRVGKKLAAALAPPKPKKGELLLTRIAEPMIDVSPNLDIVVVFLSSAYDVKRDREIVAKLPPELKDKDPRFFSWDLMGNVLVAKWMPPCVHCANAATIDIKGKPLSPPFLEGKPVALSATLAAIVSAGAKTSMTLVESNGTIAGTLELDRTAHRDAKGVRIDDDTLAVMWKTSAGVEVAWVDAPPGEPAKLVSTRVIATCP